MYDRRKRYGLNGEKMAQTFRPEPLAVRGRGEKELIQFHVQGHGQFQQERKALSELCMCMSLSMCMDKCFFPASEDKDHFINISLRLATVLPALS